MRLSAGGAPPLFTKIASVPDLAHPRAERGRAVPAQHEDLCRSDAPTRVTPRRDLSLASGAVSYSTTHLGNLPASYLQASASAATPFLGLGRPARLERPRGSVFTPGPAGVHRRSDLYPCGLGFSCFPRGSEESGIARRIMKDL
ncbi:hypothetical protein NDU88_011126 [Pleurodeles waltl]|uniref:Uncharacterized protein n=1 Tax=Pleurodeles waltl TaxID=8319 RepID=A0AAV7S2S7_PLEWA|nr:hypothetical protein NDU88_011126 [Pleurodeles waltl]